MSSGFRAFMIFLKFIIFCKQLSLKSLIGKTCPSYLPVKCFTFRMKKHLETVERFWSAGLKEISIENGFTSFSFRVHDSWREGEEEEERKKNNSWFNISGLNSLSWWVFQTSSFCSCHCSVNIPLPFLLKGIYYESLQKQLSIWLSFSCKKKYKNRDAFGSVSPCYSSALICLGCLLKMLHMSMEASCSH